jgi:hypothetical protein
MKSASLDEVDLSENLDKFGRTIPVNLDSGANPSH